MARTVRFTEPSEFLAELARYVEKVARRIVRLSYLFAPTDHGTQRVTVLAAYEVVDGGLVQLRRWTGEYWGAGFPREALDAADAVRAEVAAAVEDLGLEVRNGVFENAGKVAR